MFDWNDQEITDIIWGEARESDDHIVPYPVGNEEKNSGAFGDQTRKGRNEEASSIKHDDHKDSTIGADLIDQKLKVSPKYVGDESIEEGLGLDSWTATSTSNSMQTEQASTRVEASNNLIEIPENNASREGETSGRRVSSEIFQNQQDDEQGNFVNYRWDNIGSFDDLVTIFTNDAPIFGQESLGNVDEFWSSKDVTSNPEKSTPLSFEAPSLAVGAATLSGQLAISSEFSLNRDPLSPVSTKSTSTTFEPSQNLKTFSNVIEAAAGENSPLKAENTTKMASRNTPALNSRHIYGTPGMQNEFENKFFSCAQGVQQNQLLRTEVKLKEKYELRPLQDICGTWSTSANQLQQFDSQYAPATGQPYSPFMINQNRQLIGPQSSQYSHFPLSFSGSPLYVNMRTQYPPMVGIPQHYSGEGSHRKVISGSGASPVNADSLRKPSDPPTQPTLMTPQEKIEKLRRRQQMRAMLAIQKQQEQFNNQVSSAEKPTLDGANSEIDETMIPSSKPFGKDDSAIEVQIDDSSREDSILCHLQHIIGKLDVGIRLCIRDSLFRLSQSAVQRQCAKDTININRSGRDEGFSKGEQNSQNRFSKMPDVETETNPIDRAVAHLLFHRPLESSDKHAERPEASSSANLSFKRKADLTSSPITQLPQNLGDINVSQEGAKSSLLFTEGEQLRNSPGLDIPEISSTDEPGRGGGAVFRSGSS